ncbi:MAG: helix-turn-helix domain-containing protein [Oscillospiraceae bacterium]|nr:helix-turn-helix domain-containing protein [Oscillospiraceae bacterium]
MKLRLREMRESSHLLQRQIAIHLHCTQQTYSRYENGELQPSLRIMENLAEFYSTSVDFLLGLTDEQVPHKRSIKRHSDM